MDGISKRLTKQFNDIIDARLQHLLPEEREAFYLDSQFAIWREHFAESCVRYRTDETTDESVPCAVDSSKSGLFYAELWCRYVRANISAVLLNTNGSHQEKPTENSGKQNNVGVPERRKRSSNLHPKSLLGVHPTKERKALGITTVQGSIRDMTRVRVFLNQTTPIEGETLWDLYKRFDPDGVRRMNLGDFYTLLPREWRRLYDRNSCTYNDCLKAEKWFPQHEPIAGETLWELYQRFDPLRKRKMNIAFFYSLLPVAWKPNYVFVDATYDDCVYAEKWFGEHRPIEGETLWELYQRYDPEGQRGMYLGKFHTLLPPEWRRRYMTIDATYNDCLAAEVWFASNDPIPNETLWDLYKRYDPERKRKMRLNHFYTLLPPRFRTHYIIISASYEDCVYAEKWFAKSKQREEETLWELYQRFDPDGVRRMNLSDFHTLLPRDWKETYHKIHASYDDCLQITTWFQTQQPVADESLLDLYERYDPEGKYQMHLGQFFTLLPPAFKKVYCVIYAPYKDCIESRQWFQSHQPIAGETLWELYRRYDPNGARRMNLDHFYTMLPSAWKEQYEKIEATYDDCVYAEEWFAHNQPAEDETAWELYQRFDPEGTRRMHLGHFHTLVPKGMRDGVKKVSKTYRELSMGIPGMQSSVT